jgi:hypothetical protein
MRGTHYSFGRASDAEVFPTGVAVRSHHDKIDIELFGRIDDFVRSDSLPHHRAHGGDSQNASAISAQLKPNRGKPIRGAILSFLHKEKL